LHPQSLVTRAKCLVGSLIAGELAGRIIRWACGGSLRFHGATIVTNDSIPAKNLALLWWGMYESAERRFVRDHLSPDLPVVELGAGIGAISSVIARKLRRGQCLVCVEASPVLHALLRTNLARNAAHLRVEVIEAALSDAQGSTGFHVDRDNLGSRRRTGQERIGTVVPAVTLSSIVGLRHWPDGFQLVCDIEGGEAAFLCADPAALSTCRRMIIELHDTEVGASWISIDQLVDAAERSGFHVRARHGPNLVLERA
jgi:FkbM family methyltransferase